MPKKKNQLLATLLAAIPGLGHFYLGLLIRGFTFLGVFILILIAPIFFPEKFPDNPLFSIVAPAWIVGIVVVYIWNIVDARQKTDYVNSSTSSATQPAKYKKIIWAVPIIVVLVMAAAIYFSVFAGRTKTPVSKPTPSATSSSSVATTKQLTDGDRFFADKARLQYLSKDEPYGILVGLGFKVKDWVDANEPKSHLEVPSDYAGGYTYFDYWDIGNDFITLKMDQFEVSVQDPVDLSGNYFWTDISNQKIQDLKDIVSSYFKGLSFKFDEKNGGISSVPGETGFFLAYQKNDLYCKVSVVTNESTPFWSACGVQDKVADYLKSEFKEVVQASDIGHGYFEIQSISSDQNFAKIYSPGDPGYTLIVKKLNGNWVKLMGGKWSQELYCKDIDESIPNDIMPDCFDNNGKLVKR